MKNKTLILAMILYLAGAILLMMGFCDLDWMVNSYHNSDWSDCDVWWFSNKCIWDWWDAYMISMIRFSVGAAFLGMATGLMLYYIAHHNTFT